MAKMGRPPVVGLKILDALREYGILSIRSLSEILDYRDAVELRERVLRLEHAHYLRRRIYHLRGQTSIAFQINQDRRAREKVAELLGGNIEGLRQRALRGADFMHEDFISRVQFRLRNAFKLAHCIRDWRYWESSEARKLLPKGFDDLSLLPDLTLALSVEDEGAATTTSPRRLAWIGVEIERTEKSRARLRQKLKFYAARSAFDGVLYLSPTNELLDIQRRIFSQEVVGATTRIAHYPEGFLAQGILSASSFDPRLMSVRCGAHRLPLATWLHFLASTKTMGRGAKWTEITRTYPRAEGESCLQQRRPKMRTIA